MFKKVILFPIRLYQLIIRPILPKSCVFYAHGNLGCSDYAVKTIQKKGVLVGIVLSIYRVIRCNPWQKNFNDPQW